MVCRRWQDTARHSTARCAVRENERDVEVGSAGLEEKAKEKPLRIIIR